MTTTRDADGAWSPCDMALSLEKPTEDRARVHLVMGSIEYENCTSVIKAFASLDKAEKFLAEVQAYEDVKPVSGQVEDWYEAMAAWQNRHPAGRENAGKDSYYIESLEIE